MNSFLFQLNDGGRSTSKRPKQKRDCVVRTIALASKLPYDLVYEDLAELGGVCGRSTLKMVWQDYLAEGSPVKSIKISFPPIPGQSRMNLNKFVQEYKTGRFIVQMAGHLTTVIDGMVYDDFKPIGEKCVYAAWRIQE